MLYLILRPLLAVAAAAMDNSLVYGDAFYLTNALFKFRQVIRTFANYTIGLYFVWSILAAFFWNKLENVFSWLLKNVAIAAILVNMSRWLLAALIDLSTIATVTMWALPLHILKEDTIFKENVYYMKTYNNLNLNASTAPNADNFDFSIMYGCTQEAEGAPPSTRYYLPCGINNYQLLTGGTEGENLSRSQYKQNFIDVWKNETNINTDNITNDYCVYDKQLIRNAYGTGINDCKVLQGLLVEGKKEGIAQCATVDKILTKSVNMSWPLFTIFSSILNMSEMWLTTNSWSIKEVALNLLIKLIFCIALIIPLIAFAVVMIIRVVYLWLIIAFSPLITIAIALQRGESLSGKIQGVLSNIFKPTQIISLIFLPVIAVFWLSISIVFLSLIKNLPLIEQNVGKSDRAVNARDGCYNDAATALGIQRDETELWTEYELWPTTLTFTQWFRKTGADIGNLMSWLVINFFGIALMWMVVFATLKTNEFTSSIVDTIQKTSEDLLGTVPLPLMWGVGRNALKETPDILEQRLVGQKAQEQQSLLQNTVDEFAAWYGTDSKKLKDDLNQGTKDPSTLKWLNQNSVPENTDFLSDYQIWGKAYAQKAKSYFYDPTTKQLTDAWKAYASTKYTSEQISSWFAATAINSSLDEINDRNDALANPEFVHRMHGSEEKWYDDFLKSWDRRTKKTNNTVQAMENGLRNISKKHSSNTPSHRYLYDNNTKLTTFKRDDKNKNFDRNTTPTTHLINNAITATTIKDEDISTFHEMIHLWRDNFADLAFYTFLNGQTEITTTQWKKYSVKKDSAGIIEGFEAIEATPNPVAGTGIG